ncbi:hypothetical protein GCM10010177_46710 [Actinomadura citrea]|nr:hypothetical protein GCM10010177_46710 [Actinomadura citrea]
MTLAAVIQPLQQEVHDAMAGPGGGCRGDIGGVLVAEVVRACSVRSGQSADPCRWRCAPRSDDAWPRNRWRESSLPPHTRSSPKCRLVSIIIIIIGLRKDTGCSPAVREPREPVWEPPQSGSNDSTRLSQAFVQVRGFPFDSDRLS